MGNRINVAELLKDCPKGMELDCTIYEDVVFHDTVDRHYPIRVRRKQGGLINLNAYGCMDDKIDSKCVIFPKGKTTWEGFVPPFKFKNGDVIYNKGIKALSIFYKQTDDNTVSHCFLNILGNFKICHYHSKDLSGWEFATEEEKQKLFQAIKDNGYKWNSETKTLEKLIEPGFKVGDRIILKDNPHNIPSIKIKAVTKSQYILENGGFFYISSADEKYVLEDKFDITTLKPFESRVLIRDTKSQKWSPAIWGFYDSDYQDYKYKLVGVIARYCIPYEGNEHLLGTTNDCDEFFKTWK